MLPGITTEGPAQRSILACFLLLLTVAIFAWSVYMRITVHDALPSVYSIIVLVCELLLFPTMIIGGMQFFLDPKGEYSQYQTAHAEDSANANTEIKDAVESGLPSTVDVFVPCYKEDESIIRDTLVACQAMNMPDSIREVNVYLLDDGGKDERREMCEKLGVHYLSRPDRGRGAKAGNVNHALSVTAGELVLLFDADMAPVITALDYLIDLINKAPKEVVMVQSPQRFRDITKCDLFASRNLVFSDFTMPMMGAHGVCPFVGTGAIFKREALVEVGGFPEYSVTEDTALSLEFHMRGYKTICAPEPVAYGTSPHNAAQLLNQRMRWIWGGFQVLAEKNPVFNSELPFHARWLWATAFLWYATGPIFITIHFAIATGLYSGAQLIAQGALVRFSFVYVLLVRLAWMVYATGDVKNAFVHATDWIISENYYQPGTFVVLTYLAAKWMLTCGTGTKFKSSGKANTDPEHLIVFILFLFVGAVVAMGGVTGLLRTAYATDSEGQRGYVPLSLAMIFFAYKLMACLWFWSKPLPAPQSATTDTVAYIASRTRKMVFFFVPVALEYLLYAFFFATAMAEYMGTVPSFLRNSGW